MRLLPNVSILRLAAVATLLACAQTSAGMAEENAVLAGAEPVALSDTDSVQDISAAVERYKVDLAGRSGTQAGAEPATRRGDDLWFGFKLANTTSLPMERLLIVKRPLMAGAGLSVGTASALPSGAAVEWVGAGAPEPLPALSRAFGAGVFRFTVPANSAARLAVPGAEGPVTAAVMTRSAYDNAMSFRFVILGLGFGLLGVLAALSFARWLGAGDRAAAASAGVGLAALWVLATQFGHHLPLVGADSGLDTGLKAAGLFLLAGALLFSVRMQVNLTDRFLSVLTWSSVVCVALALAALPGWAVSIAAGPVLLAAAIAALAASVTDALNHKSHIAVRLPDLASLSALVLILAAAGILAAGDPSVTADRWSIILHGAMIVSLGVLGASGLIVHHGVTVPLLREFHSPEPERPEPAPEAAQALQASESFGPARTPEAPASGGPTEIPVAPALGPEPESPDLAPHELTPEPLPTHNADEPENAGTVEQAASTTEAKEAVTDEPAEPPAAEREIVKDLRIALAKGDIDVQYQAVVGLADGSIAGFEALARWQREGHGPVSPDTFIPLAEEAGLIGDLGAQVLGKAAHQLGEWQRRYGESADAPRMNVNISARQLAQSDLVDTVREVLQREGLKPGSLTLELTESAPIDDPEAAVELLLRLKEQGVSLALDDFGTGYSTLASLQQMPFDILKIDRSLLAGMGHERGERILRAMIDLAHELKMTVVAEGVQEAADLERLRTMGCDFVQGPFCGPPLTAEAAEAVLRRDRNDIGPKPAASS